MTAAATIPSRPSSDSPRAASSNGAAAPLRASSSGSATPPTTSAASRILIVIGGSPPHKEDIPELTQLVRTFKEKNNGAVGAIDVTDRLHVEYEHADWVAHGSKGEFHASPTPEFYREVSDSLGDMAHQGGGEIVRLGENKALLREVMALTFGTRWRVEMAKYMDRLQ